MKARPRGFTLVELMIALAVLTVLIALGASSFSAWITNARIRTTAEAIQHGLQLARAEAVRRNAVIAFSLTTTSTNDCTVAAVGADQPTNWLISFGPDDITGKCAVALVNEDFPLTDGEHNPPPRLFHLRPAAEGSGSIVAFANQTQIAFNGLGRMTPAPANPVSIDVKPPGGASCTTFRCLRVTVSAGGQVRTCDPAYLTTGSDPQRCS